TDPKMEITATQLVQGPVDTFQYTNNQTNRTNFGSSITLKSLTCYWTVERASTKSLKETKML
ncbi:MAG TPA: hypothetical protein VFM05_11930, partial [Candidatus Saccharimonadales bacterium]|nr:hypothetical protein [Candidatus Saccharimonadales bacterium]